MDDLERKSRYELIKDMSVEELAFFIAGIETGQVTLPFKYACDAQFKIECFKCAKKDINNSCYMNWIKEKSYKYQLLG